MKLSLALLAVITNSVLALPSSLKRTPPIGVGTRHQKIQYLANKVSQVERRNGAPVANSTVTSSNYSGAALLKPSSGHFTNVNGNIKVPTSQKIGFTGSRGYGSAWVGVDGITNDPTLQGGVEWIVDYDGTISTTLWYSWWPADTVYIDEPIANPGDVIDVGIIVRSPNTAAVVFTNHNTGHRKNIELSKPQVSDPLEGANALWIVEDVTSQDSQGSLNNFGSVVFTGVNAMTSTGAKDDLGSGVTVYYMGVDEDSPFLTRTTLDSRSQMTVKYVG